MSLFGKRTADPIQGSPAQKPSPFSTQTSNTNSNSLFGNSLISQNQNTPSIFGNQNPGTANPTQTNNLFGNTSNTQSTNSIFGTNSQSATPQSNGLFGSLSNNNNNNNNNNNTQSTTQSNNLFGSLSNNANNNATPSATSQSNNLFGNLSNNNNNNTSNSLFGSLSNKNNNNTSNSLFGSLSNNNNNNLSTPQSNNSNLFGSFSNNNNTSNTFTAGFGGQQASSTPINNFLLNSTNNSTLNRSAPPTTNSALSTLRSSTAQLARRPITLSELSIQDRIIKIHASWNVSDPQCQFQFFFYNVVPPEQVHLYGRPNHLAPDDPRWQRAKRNNPDPSRLVPTLAIGFEDLSKRVTAQQKQAQAHLSKLGEISNRLNEIARKHNLETSSRLHKLKTEQVKLSTRLMGLVNKLNGIVLHSSSSSAVAAYQTHSQPSYQHQQLMRNSQKEEELIQRVKALKSILDQSGGKSKISELWSTLHQIKNFGGFFISNNGAGPTGNPSVVNHGSHHPSNGSQHLSNWPGHAGFVGVGSGDGGGGKWSLIDDKEIKKVLEVRPPVSFSRSLN